MGLPRLLVVTDWSLGAGLLERLQAVLGLGSRVAVQHRHPGASMRLFVEEARALESACRSHGVPLFINGRVDVARLLGAHLHLPAGGLLASEVRPFLSPGAWISCAVHSPEEALDARGADLSLVSPVFSPGSKPEDRRPALGPEGFHRLARLLRSPAYALGGITPDRVPGLGSVAGVAAVSGVLHAADPRAAAETLLAALHV